MATIILANTTIEAVEFSRVKDPGQIREILQDDYHELFYLPNGTALLIPQQRADLPKNDVAIAVCTRAGRPRRIVGNAILYAPTELARLLNLPTE